MSKTYRWVSPLSWTLLGAALGTAGTLGAADDRQLAQLAARVSALERALVVTAGAVELRGPGTSLKLESGTARLRAPAQLQLEATRIEIEAADLAAIIDEVGGGPADDDSPSDEDTSS